MSLRLRRVYDRPTKADGFRVLVDRLWPRGLNKEEAAVDEWARDVAPSRDLRVWYGHRPDRFAEFARRYRSELRKPPAAEAAANLAAMARRRTVTLLTATRDLDLSGAAVLQGHLKEK